MSFNENAFDLAIALHRMLQLMRKVSIRVEVKSESRWIPLFSSSTTDVRITNIVNLDYDSQYPILPVILHHFMIYGEVFLYKVKTNRYIANNLVEANYSDGSIAGLKVLSNRYIRVKDYDPEVDKQVLISPTGETLSPTDYIKIANWKPMLNTPTISMFNMLEKNLNNDFGYGNAADITGIPYELIYSYNALPDDRKRALIRRVLEDAVIPYAELFIAAIDKQIGLSDDMRLCIQYDHDTDMLAVWEGR